jgi:hypothetical protein
LGWRVAEEYWADAFPLDQAAHQPTVVEKLLDADEAVTAHKECDPSVTHREAGVAFSGVLFFAPTEFFGFNPPPRDGSVQNRRVRVDDDWNRRESPRVLREYLELIVRPPLPIRDVVQFRPTYTSSA